MDRTNVFDWDKAANLIKELGLTDAQAGIMETWRDSRAPIYANGEPITEEGYPLPWVASAWGQPALARQTERGLEFIPCFFVNSELPEDDPRKKWDARTYWPSSARAILDGK